MLAVGLATALSAETIVKGVKIRFNRSQHDRRLVDKSVALTFRRHRAPVDRQRVRSGIVFDVTTHMRGGAVGELVDLAPFGGAIAGPMIQARHINDYWFSIEAKSGSYTVLEIPKESSPILIAKANPSTPSVTTRNGRPFQV